MQSGTTMPSRICKIFIKSCTVFLGEVSHFSDVERHSGWRNSAVILWGFYNGRHSGAIQAEPFKISQGTAARHRKRQYNRAAIVRQSIQSTGIHHQNRALQRLHSGRRTSVPPCWHNKMLFWQWDRGESLPVFAKHNAPDQLQLSARSGIGRRISHNLHCCWSAGVYFDICHGHFPRDDSPQVRENVSFVLGAVTTEITPNYMPYQFVADVYQTEQWCRMRSTQSARMTVECQWSGLISSTRKTSHRLTMTTMRHRMTSYIDDQEASREEI